MAKSKLQIEKEDLEIRKKSALLREGLRKESLERQMRASRKKGKTLVGPRRLAEHRKFSKLRASHRLLIKLMTYKRRGSGNLTAKKKYRWLSTYLKE